MSDQIKQAYVAPDVRLEGSLQELTLAGAKNFTNTPDGYYTHPHHLLTT